MRRLVPILGTLLAALAMVLAPAGGPAPAGAADCPTGSGDGATFGYTGHVEHIAVPLGVDRVDVVARGGHGGQYDSTGNGGPGGLVTATLDVKAHDCLSIQVGRMGKHEGGWGYGKGGDPGSSSLGHDGAGGGGGTAVLLGSTPLVVAGGGGGGGGQSTASGWYGGDGGAGVGGHGPGTPQGADGKNPKWDWRWILYGRGGWGGDGDKGGDGATSYDPLNGGGGGGGGGWKGGDGGEVFIPNPWSRPPDNNPYGGGGGGGGSSYVVSGSGGTFERASTHCVAGGAEAPCDGEVVLTWLQEPARIVTAGGDGQTATITERFGGPLRARVTAQSGDPVPNVTVTFALPATGPSATFPGGVRTATATTAADGVATSPVPTAGSQAGAWTATATVEHVSAPARFPLHDAPATASVAVQVDPSAPVDGAPVDLYAHVAGAPAAAPAPTGEVRFEVDGVSAGGAVALDGSGLAHLPGVALEAGDREITAVYGGDADHATAAGRVPVTVARRDSVVALASAQNPSALGGAVAFTATVDPAPAASGSPTGRVQLLVDGAAEAEAPLVAGEAAFAPVTFGAAGPHQIEARYLGDERFAPAGDTIVQSVGDAATATTVVGSSPHATYGAPVSWTITVTSTEPGTPGGSVDVRTGGTTLCAGLSLDASGQATCTPATPPDPGVLTIVADYAGAGAHAPSEGRTTQTIVPAAVTVAAEVVPGAVTFGDALRLHADVAPAGAGTPSGSVRFLIDGTPVGAPAPVGPAGATLEGVPSPPAGPFVVRAVYSGDTRFAPGESIATGAVDRAPSSIALTSSAPLAVAGHPVVITAAVADEDGRPVTGGSVRFRVDGALRGPAEAVRDGVARSPGWTDLAPGTHTIVAEYLGDTSRLPAMGELLQAIVPASGGGGGGGPTPPAPPDDDPGQPPRPVVPEPPLGPPAGPAGAAPCGAGVAVAAVPCGAGVAITALRRDGDRVHLAGVTSPGRDGRRVTVRLRGKRVAATPVRADGSFAVSVPAPRGPRPGRAPYRVAVAGDRSAVVTLRPPVRVARVEQRTGGVRVTLAPGRDAPRRVVLRAGDCAPEHATRLAGRRARLAVEAPHGDRVVLYRLHDAGGPVPGALWIAVRPRT